MATAPAPRKEILRFAPNVPVEVALKWPDGKIVSGQYGEQMYYSLTDGRAMYLPMDVGAKINLLELAPGELFTIAKRHSGHKGDIPTWDVRKHGERYEPLDEQPPELPSDLEVQLRDSIHQVQARRIQQPAPAPIGSSTTGAAAISPCQDKPTPAPAASLTEHANPTRPRTKLEDALKTVVQACHAAQLYAAEIGFAMPPWSSEDLRTMANALIIDSQRGAR